MDKPKKTTKDSLIDKLNRDINPRKKTEAPQPVQEPVSDENNFNEYQRLNRRGRPPKGTQTMVRRVHASFTLDENLLEGVRAIAYNNRLPLNAVIEEYLRRGINNYEKKFGPITSRESNIPSQTAI